MKKPFALLALLSSAALAGAPCLTFDAQEYCLSWASVDGATTSNEYLRSGETVDAWVRMVTVKDYAGTKELKDFIPGYMDSVRPYMAMKADVFGPNEKKHKDELLLLLLLLAPDKSHYEYVIHRVYVDEEGPVRSVIFSLRIPFAKQVSFNEVMKSRDGWMKELSGLEPQALTKLPEPSNQPLHPTPTAAEAPASGAGERRR